MFEFDTIFFALLAVALMTRTFVAALFAGTTLLSGCASLIPEPNMTAGTLSGKTTVTWIGYNLFEYVPDANEPLKFVTSDGITVQPERMQTDGGSIPPIFQPLPGFSPWGYGPAYVIHDWLFEQHHCHYPGWERISFEDSARILGEAIQTLMDIGMVQQNEEARVLIEAGVRSDIARALWDKEGACMRGRIKTMARFAGAPPVVTVIDLSRVHPMK